MTNFGLYKKMFNLTNPLTKNVRASREDMAAVASPQLPISPTTLGAIAVQNATLLEDPDVWRPT